MSEIRSVLITGGAGFLGRALARYLLQHGMAERLCVLSRNEHSQAAMRAELHDDPRMKFFIGDIREESRLTRAMQGVDLVIHAAALKRIEVGRYSPDELVKTNVLGTLNVVSASRLAGVKKVMAISSDKAVRPQFGSAYGQTKALMETIILAGNDTGPADSTRFGICRYGNIWGSTGSVLPKWVSMIRTGAKSVPLTSPEATRFFMKIEEAVELVLSASFHMTGGEIAVPELPAYRMGDLAEALEIKTDIVGLPNWEKLHEEMQEGHPSDRARRMTVSELRRHALDFVKSNP